eukprot:gene1386-biopygen1236
MATWQRQRAQIMEWVTARISQLQELPEEVRSFTEVLIGSELLTTDFAGALALGTWPEVAGAWAARKAAESDKFGEVSAWVQALLALVEPLPTGASLGTITGGAGASGSGGATASAGTGAAGATGSSGTGIVAPAAAVDPNAIAAAIASALQEKLDAFGERLSVLEAQRSAAGGAGLQGSGADQACTDLVHEAARLCPQLTNLRNIHPFGKAPMRTLEAHAFDPLVYVLPELRAEECELDELPAGRKATVEHWRAFVHLLQAWVGEFQRFVKSQVPSFAISDVMVNSFFKKRKRVTFEGEEEEAKAAGGGRGLLPPLNATRRNHLATLGAGFRTVNEEQLARALRGELAPEDVARPPGAGSPLTSMPSRGPLARIDLLVSPVQRLQQEDEGRLKLKDGELTVVAKKKKKCKDFDEWERGFLRILCEAPADARDDLADFMAWSRTIAAEFSFYHFNEFYKHLVWQVQRSTTGILLDGYDRVWRVYKLQHGLQEKGAKTKAPRGVPLVPPGEADVPGGWWEDLLADEFIPVWDVLGGPRRHDKAPMTWEIERRAPLPVTQLSPDTWASPSEPWRTRVSARWPELHADILLRATVEGMEACGTSEGERRCYEEECVWVGCAVPTLTRHAHIVAAAFREWHDVSFLVRCAACGAGWPSEEIAIDEPYRVPNYVGQEHMEVMREELTRESEAGHIFLAGWRLPLGVIALGMVEKVRKGKVKYRPVSDYSRPADVGVNAMIELEHDEFTTVKEAYGMLRPGYRMVKVDMEAAYGSVGIASQFWPHQGFEFDGVRWMDARAPFGNRALPGIFMRWTRAIMAWMRARGIPTVGYLDDFFCVLETREQAEEAMMLLVEFVTFLDFKVNNAKCEGPSQVLEFLGVLLDTSGEVCTASIDEERIVVVVKQAGALKAQAAREMVARRALESLLGLLAFCSHVYNGRRVVLERRLVDERHYATDASGTLGFGGVWERLFFMLSWEDLARLPQRPWFPRRAGCPSSWSINYLELFAVWWAVMLWGHRMSGRTVVVRINNQSAMHQPVYINTKDNLLADLLSRLDMTQFLAEHKAFLRADIWRQDRDDWMVCPVRWAALDQDFGPFTVDSCVAVSRVHSYCYHNWSREEDARVQRFDGHNARGNLPFSIMVDIIRNFLRCKRRQQWGTAACFHVPMCDGDEDWELVKSLPDVFRVVRMWRQGTHLFTAPDRRGHGKTAWGPPEELVQELQREAERYRVEALAPETRRCYGTRVRAFVTFCISFACLGCLEPLLPATNRTLCMFITYCIWFMRPDTIKNYLAGMRQLHLQRGHEWVPVAARHAVAATLQGVKRCWGRPPRPVMPLTLADLAKMALLISAHDPRQEALSAAILVGFFGLFRKDNLTTGKAGAWNTRGALVRDDVLFHEDGLVVWIRVRHSKTIQCGERHHWVPLRAVPGSLLCPVRDQMRLMERTAGRPGNSALFVMEKVTGRRASVVPMTHDALVAGIKSLAERVGLDLSSYAGHSLWRGGATAAMRLDVNSIYIKMQGD